MADKSVIESLEIRMRALVDAHRRLDARCRALVVERDRLKAANRTLEERVRGLDAELGRMRLADSLAGGSGETVDTSGMTIDEAKAAMEMPQ